jgi:hypothetical protein
MITEKHQFMAPTDVAELEHEPKAGVVAEAVASSPLVGTWSNCDKATRGIVKIVIASSGLGISVHAFGACTPTPCDMGTVPGVIYADNVSSTPAVAFTARYSFNFKETIVVGRLDSGCLVVETFDSFKDGSGRSAYYSKYYMGK